MCAAIGPVEPALAQPQPYSCTSRRRSRPGIGGQGTSGCARRTVLRLVRGEHLDGVLLAHPAGSNPTCRSGPAPPVSKQYVVPCSSTRRYYLDTRGAGPLRRVGFDPRGWPGPPRCAASPPTRRRTSSSPATLFFPYRERSRPGRSRRSADGSACRATAADPAPHVDRPRRPRHGPAAPGGRRREAHLRRRVVRLVPRQRLRQPLPRQGAGADRRRRARPGGVGDRSAAERCLAAVLHPARAAHGADATLRALPRPVRRGRAGAVRVRSGLGPKFARIELERGVAPSRTGPAVSRSPTTSSTPSCAASSTTLSWDLRGGAPGGLRRHASRRPPPRSRSRPAPALPAGPAGPRNGFDVFLGVVSAPTSVNPRDPAVWPRAIARQAQTRAVLRRQLGLRSEPCSTWPVVNDDHYLGPFTGSPRRRCS